MAVVRHYVMTASDERGEELAACLKALAAALAGIDDCEGSALFRDRDDANRYVFIEHWTSLDAHARSASRLPADLLADLMKLLAGKPAASWLDPL